MSGSPAGAAGEGRSPTAEASGLEKASAVGGRAVHALRGADITVWPGEFVVLLGPSGSGKSTLLSLLAGLEQPSAGRVSLQGHDLTNLDVEQRAALRRAHVGLIFQTQGLLPALSARENVEFPLALQRVGAEERSARAGELLTAVGLAGRENALPEELSGGEQQRVGIARALSTRPSLLLADEPTGMCGS